MCLQTDFSTACDHLRVGSEGTRVYKDRNGKIVKAENGFYDSKDGSIHIDLNAGSYGRGSVLFTVAHELAHFIQDWSPKHYKQLCNILMKEYTAKGQSVDELVANQQAFAKEHGRELSWEEAYDEVIADSMESILADGRVMELMRDIEAEDQTLGDRVKQFFRDICDLLKRTIQAYSNVKPDSAEGRMVQGIQEIYDQLQQLFAEGLYEGGDNYRKAEKNTTDDGGVQYSIKRTQSMSWQEQIDSALYGGKNIRRNDTLVAGNSANTLIGAEIDNKPLAVPLSILTKASNGKDISHSIKRGKLAKLDEGLQNAPIVIVNPARNAVVYVTDIKQGGLPIVAAFDMNSTFDGDNVHKSTSIHLQVDVKSMLASLPKSATIYVQKNEPDPVGATNNLRGLAAKIKFIDKNVSQNSKTVKEKFSARKGETAEKALSHFGRTYSWKETGYLLTDGAKLDFSGRHEGASGGYRTVDHRDILDVYPEDTELNGNGAMVDFMSQGNIRIMPECNGINLQVQPTKAQEQALGDFISRARGEVILDIDDANGNTVVSVEYPKGTYYSKVLQDIRNYFADGTEPVVSELTKYRFSGRKGEKPDNRMTEADIKAVQSIGRKSVNAFSSADIKATERFAKQYWKEMGVKSPFFRAWFGDWRENDQTEVRVASQKGDTRGIQKNTDTGWDIQVSAQVFNETKAHNSLTNREARPYLPYINDIVNKAVLLESYGLERGKQKSPNSLLMHSLYAVSDIGNGPEVLKLYVEEMNNPGRVETAKRAYQLRNIEKAFNASVRVQGKSLSSLTNASNAIRTVADLFAAVKRMDADFQPNSASKVVNADKTPKVMYHGSPAQFTIFDKKKARSSGAYGSGFYFTDSQSHASTYGQQYSVYLNIRNPLQYGGGTVSREQVRKFLEAVAENEDYSIENYGTYDVDSIVQNIIGRESKTDAFKVIQDVGATAVGDMVKAVELFKKVYGTKFTKSYC